MDLRVVGGVLLLLSLGVWTAPAGDDVTQAGEEDEEVWPGREPHVCENTGGNQSQLNSFLWTIHRDPPSYFFGTIHVPYTRVWQYIPENTKEAFHRAEEIYFELDLTDPYTISALANCQLLPQGEHLSNVIPRDMFRRLKRHLEYVKNVMPTWMTEDQRGRGLYADYLFSAITGNWERKRPIWVMLMVNSLTEADIRSRGIPVLDLYFAQEAERLSKVTGAVERVDEQCVPLNELNFSQVLFALNQTLSQHETTRGDTTSKPYTTEDLISHYNCGDLNNVLFSHDTAQVPNLVNNSLPPEQLTTAKRIDQYFKNELIYLRNQRMADRIEDLLMANPNTSFFFAFGAGHFLGNNTVIDKLKEKGHEITHSQSTSELYLGKNYKRKRKRYPPLLADMPADFPMPPVIINGNLEYLDPFYGRRRNSRHKQRHRNRKKGRRKNNGEESDEEEERPVPTDSDRLKRPQFNDLWVRLESTSFGPNSYIRRQNAADQTTKPSPVPVYAMYNSSRGHHLPVFSFLVVPFMLLLLLV